MAGLLKRNLRKNNQENNMPTVDGKKFPYTPAGKNAAARASARTRTEGSKTPFDKTRNPDEVKTKGDLLAENIIPTIKNMGY